MDEQTRPATSDDLDEVVRLAREGRTAIADARGGRLWLERQAPREPLDSTYAAAIASPDALLQLALIDDVPLGFLLVELETIDNSCLAVSQELYVTPEARGVSLGEIMMNEALSWASTAGAFGMDGYALPGDRATKNFFETFGLVARGIVVHRSIDGP